jgi:hypothetical protein
VAAASGSSPPLEELEVLDAFVLATPPHANITTTGTARNARRRGSIMFARQQDAGHPRSGQIRRETRGGVLSEVAPVCARAVPAVV